MKVFELFLGLLLSFPASAQVVHDTSSYNKAISIKTGEERLDAYRFFFKGEVHDFPSANARSLFVLLKYLHQEGNVRCLAMEFGPDLEWLANKYLETGNDSLLSQATYFEMAFWKNLRELNKDLPADKKIKVAGFDFNRSVFTGEAFGAMVKGKDVFPREKIQSILEKIINWGKSPSEMNEMHFLNKEMDADLNQLKSYHTLYPEMFKEYFGIDYSAFSLIINNPVISTSRVKRDKEVIKVLGNRLHEFSHGAILFNYGIAHVFLDGVGLAHLLSEKDEYRDKVCSIYPYYDSRSVKSIILSREDKNLPFSFRGELDLLPSYSLVSLDDAGIYPSQYRKTQWVLVIKQ